jgi:hypothetical protein
MAELNFCQGLVVMKIALLFIRRGIAKAYDLQMGRASLLRIIMIIMS